MNIQELKELREIFRERFRKEDFCIGEEEVEKVFRELLEEPEPISLPILPNDKDINKILTIELEKFTSNAKELFERDVPFYTLLKKK